MREIVKQEVGRSVTHYEHTVGNPRHTANQELLNQIKGGIRTLKIIGTTGVALLTLYIAWHHR